MKNKRLDFLCFLAKQAAKDICQILEDKSAEIITPVKQKQKEMSEQIAYEAFRILYPVEKAYHVLMDTDQRNQKIQEQAFLMIYPVEKFLVKCKDTTRVHYEESKIVKAELCKSYTYHKQKLHDHLSYQTQKIQEAMIQFRKRVISFHSLKLPFQCNKIQMYMHEAYVGYLNNLHFKAEHQKLERLYAQVRYAIRKSYEYIENHIVAYFTMIFGIFLRWARGSSLRNV